MSLLTSFYDYQFVRNPNLENYAFTDYSSKEMNEIQKQLYLISRLFMSYNNLLLLVKSMKDRKFLDKAVDAIFIVLVNQSAKAASAKAKSQLGEQEMVSVFGKRRSRRTSKLLSEMRKQLI